MKGEAKDMARWTQGRSFWMMAEEAEDVERWRRRKNWIMKEKVKDKAVENIGR